MLPAPLAEMTPAQRLEALATLGALPEAQSPLPAPLRQAAADVVAATAALAADLEA